LNVVLLAVVLCAAIGKLNSTMAPAPAAAIALAPQRARREADRPDVPAA
jgi:hypothetical protein